MGKFMGMQTDTIKASKLPVVLQNTFWQFQVTHVLLLLSCQPQSEGQGISNQENQFPGRDDPCVLTASEQTTVK